jgi:hypothetical protein
MLSHVDVSDGWRSKRINVGCNVREICPHSVSSNAVNCLKGYAPYQYKNSGCSDGTTSGYGMADKEVGLRVPVLYIVQTGFWFHPTSYPASTGGSFLWGKVPRVSG